MATQVTIDFSRTNGYLALYLRFRSGKVHATHELKPVGLSADVDREGRVLGVEVIKTFSTKTPPRKLEGTINLDEIQAAVEKKFHPKLDRAFQEVREAGHSIFAHSGR